MKKMLLLIIACIMSQYIFAQITVTIGTGTTISGGTSVTPYKTHYQDGQDQILFTAAELSAAGLYAGNITKLAFHVYGTPAPITLNSFTISMQQTALSSLTDFITSGWTQVYTGDVVAVAGWNTYTFTTPFAWNGSSNIIFKVCYHNTTSTDNTQVYYTDTSPSTGVHDFNLSNTTPGCDLPSYSENFRPDVQITEDASAPIPTLSEWGLIILGFLFLTTGTMVILRWRGTAA